jgi:hypothetical protein
MIYANSKNFLVFAMAKMLNRNNPVCVMIGERRKYFRAGQLSKYSHLVAFR